MESINGLVGPLLALKFFGNTSALQRGVWPAILPAMDYRFLFFKGHFSATLRQLKPSAGSTAVTSAVPTQTFIAR